MSGDRTINNPWARPIKVFVTRPALRFLPALGLCLLCACSPPTDLTLLTAAATDGSVEWTGPTVAARDVAWGDIDADGLGDLIVGAPGTSYKISSEDPEEDAEDEGNVNQLRVYI